MFYMVQAGTSLQLVQTDGTITTLTLPTGVTIDATIRGIIVAFAQKLFFVRAGSINLWLDPTDTELTVRPMSIPTPLSPPTVAAGASTGLTGAYRTKVSYFLKNPAGAVIIESPLSEASLAVTLANQDLDISAIPISPDASLFVSATSLFLFGRRIYRTASGGSSYFPCVDIDDNSTTEIFNSITDSALDELPADPSRGNPPGTIVGTSIDLMCAWNNRLFAKASAIDRVDHLIYTEEDDFGTWSPDNDLLAKPVGEDQFGITGFLPRRDELGIGKRGRLMKLVGSSNDDFELITIAEGAGVLAPFSCTVIRDIGYYLGLDGVYEYGPDGVKNITNDSVAPWFLTDDYFNRAIFPYALGAFNSKNNTYDLQLAAVGSSVFDRWISFDLARRQWLGPHKTGAFTPTCRSLLRDANGGYLPIMASSSGFLYSMNQSGGTDDGTGIVIDWITKWFSANAPDMMHFWDRATLHLKKQSAGTLTLTPRVGDTAAADGTAQTVNMASGDRAVLARWGVGRLLRVEFSHTANGQDVEIYGIEQPFTEIGRR
jgi:hypothetical protein